MRLIFPSTKARFLLLCLLPGLGVITGCQDELLSPLDTEGPGIRINVSGGFAGADYTLFLDGTTGSLVGESCGNLCDFAPGQVLAVLSEEQLAHLENLFRTAGIHSMNDTDFGVQCCDQFYFDAWYEDELGSRAFRGSSEALPQALRDAVSALLAFMQGPRPMVVDFERAKDAWPQDGIHLESPAVDGDVLSVGVSYGGGCKIHLIQAVAWGGWMESAPLQVKAFLSHEDYDDPCDAWLSQDLTIDLTPLKRAYQSAYGTVTPGTTTLKILLEDARLASPLGAWVLEYVF